jgi:hypothetical protein
VAPRLLGLVFEDDEERVIVFLSEKMHGEALSQDDYRINWYISPPYVARARQMPSLRRGLIAKGGL